MHLSSTPYLSGDRRGPCHPPQRHGGRGLTGQTLSAAGGIAPYSFAVASGAARGPHAVFRTDSSPGRPRFRTSSFTVIAIDANGCTGSRAYCLRHRLSRHRCSCHLLFPAPGLVYNQTLAAVGRGPYTFAVTSRICPDRPHAVFGRRPLWRRQRLRGPSTLP